jgi:anti-sigma factor RsiW
MMDGAHPEELDLLAFVEEELDAARKAAVAEHVAACARCAESVRRLETARYALRSAPLLELPGENREAALTALPDRSVRRGWSWRPRLVVPVLATAAVAAVVAGVVLSGDLDREEGSEAAKVATVSEAAGEDAGGVTAPEAATTDMSRALSGDQVASVEGPPQEVARLLRRRGLDAHVVDSAVQVRDAEPDDVRRALVGRLAGPVPVFAP